MSSARASHFQLPACNRRQGIVTAERGDDVNTCGTIPNSIQPWKLTDEPQLIAGKAAAPSAPGIGKGELGS